MLSIQERVASLTDDTAQADPLEAFVHSAIGLSIGFLLEGQSLPYEADLEDAYVITEKASRDASLREGVALLPERERLIVTLHYLHHIPFIQIAEDIGLTKGRISQLHRQALDRLRRHLGDAWSCHV